MNILFICSCLEEGKDGVGDYTRRLAGELIAQGHEISLLSIHDKYISGVVEEEQLIDGVCISVLRISSIYSYRRKEEIAQQWIQKINPEWLSLQYVPYGFHAKGLPVSLASLLKQLGKGRKWHIMFHELWIGVSRISSFKRRFVGFVQRQLAIRLVNQLVPHVITTSNKLYQLLLYKASVVADELPLFSNIPNVTFNGEYINRYVKKSLEQNLLIDSNHVIVSLFGSIHADSHLDDFLEDQIEKGIFPMSKTVLLIFGNLGQWGGEEIERLIEKYKHKILFLRLGLLSAENISTLLQFSDYGIACTPSQYMGKSGVFAAYRAHNLNVMFSSKLILSEYTVELDGYLNQLMSRPSSSWTVTTVASSFLLLLKSK